VEVRDGACRLVSDGRLAGSVISLDTAVRNVVESGIALVDAVQAATRNPLDLLGVTDRGRLAPGQRADLVELDDDLNVTRVMKAGSWLE
jgi:N-acetylglucosamine-6-phosphate deacetylase